MRSVDVSPKIIDGMKLCVDSLDRFMEVGITECNVPHNRPTYASEHNTQSTAIDPFKQHILRREASKNIVLHGYTVILYPNIHVVYMHISATNVQAVRVL